MAGRGVHFALDVNDERRFLEAAGDDEAVMEVVQEIEDRWQSGRVYETDKAWDAIHRCLTDGTLAGEVPAPLHLAVLGGRSLYEEDDYVVRYLTPAEVAEVARALPGLDREWFLGRFQTLDPDDYDGPMDEDDFEYTWENFAGLRDFLRTAADNGLAVIFTVDP